VSIPATSAKFASLGALPHGARVGTSSQRRRAQLKALRPDIEAVEFRGNVDTRLRKLGEGQVDAILLAAAGLDRLEKTVWIRERFEPIHFCPAAGQGSLGIETRQDDSETIAALAFLNDPDTRFAITAERTALAALGGGCQVPIGIYCRPYIGPDAQDTVEIFGVVADPATGQTIRAYEKASREATDPESLGRFVAQRLMHDGAGALMQLTGHSLAGEPQ